MPNKNSKVQPSSESGNAAKLPVVRRKARISFTKAEIEALHSTADQMSDDLEYYNFMPKKEFAAFCKAYGWE
jgi:hypothetical protein